MRCEIWEGRSVSDGARFVTEPTPILNYRMISEQLGTAGQPTREQLAALRDAGYEVVINLAMPASSSWLADEDEIVRAAGLLYHHIPVVWEAPSLENLQQFFGLMDTHSQKKLFVHCAMNMRVSAFVYLYRVLKLNESPECAEKDLHDIWKPSLIWQQFIDQALSADLH